jgi:hypothetical protein
MKLYKYMTLESSHKFLQNCSMRLTPRSCLNDPFEILAPRNIKNKYKKEIDTNRFQEYLDFSGVISLTETKDNLLMWSHYAKEHSGVVFEFDVDLNDPFGFFNFFDFEKTDLPLFSKVYYRKNRSYEDVSSNFSAESLARHYYLTKSDEWLYEKEYRFILPFHKATDVTFEISKLPHKISNLFPESIRNIEHPQTIRAGLLDFQLLKYLWTSSKDTGVVFTIKINEFCVNSLCIGNNCDTSRLKKYIHDEVHNFNDSSALRRFYSPLTKRFFNIYKGVIHPDRYELIFKNASRAAGAISEG